MGMEATYFLCIPVSHSRNPSSQMLAKGPTCKPFWKVALGLLAERFPAYLLTGSLLNKSARVIFFFITTFLVSDFKKTKHKSQIKSLLLKLPSDFLMHFQLTKFTPRMLPSPWTYPA